jgi:hypothetical protein
VPLTIAPCRSLCDWARTPATQAGERVFACRGCGSQWVRSEPWAPRQADGSWPDGVREELREG